MAPRVAFVTGGSRGLGQAIAIRLGVSGFDVVLTYDQQRELAEATVDEVKSTGRRASAFRLDVADGLAVREVVQQIVDDYGSIDVLVCNAGIFSRSSIAETSDEEFTRTFDVNVRGVFNCLRSVLPIMVTQRRGRVITISSHNAKRGTGASSKATYAATKSAVESYTKGAAIEVAPFGITVNCVSPGWIMPSDKHQQLSEFQERLQATIPLGRPGRPENVAAAVAYLASDDADYITGEILDVNGGTWMD